MNLTIKAQIFPSFEQCKVLDHLLNVDVITKNCLRVFYNKNQKIPTYEELAYNVSEIINDKYLSTIISYEQMNFKNVVYKYKGKKIIEEFKERVKGKKLSDEEKKDYYLTQEEIDKLEIEIPEKNYTGIIGRLPEKRAYIQGNKVVLTFIGTYLKDRNKKWIKFDRKNLDRYDVQKIGCLSFKKIKSKYYVLIPIEIEEAKISQEDKISQKAKNISEKKIIGIDPGMSSNNTMVCTNEEFNLNYQDSKHPELGPTFKALRKNEERLKMFKSIRDKEYRYEDNSKFFYIDTSRFRKLDKKIKRLQYKISQQKNYIEHVWSKRIAQKNDVVIVENTSLFELKKKNKGTYANSMAHRYPIGTAMLKLKYKCEKFGKTFHKIKRPYFPSSEFCFNCGSELQFKGKGTYKQPYCEKCGTVDRDRNAATNILKQGKSELRKMKKL